MNESRHREGYTAGSGDGLKGKANEYEMPESERKPPGTCLTGAEFLE